MKKYIIILLTIVIYVLLPINVYATQDNERFPYKDDIERNEELDNDYLTDEEIIIDEQIEENVFLGSEVSREEEDPFFVYILSGLAFILASSVISYIVLLRKR